MSNYRCFLCFVFANSNARMLLLASFIFCKECICSFWFRSVIYVWFFLFEQNLKSLLLQNGLDTKVEKSRKQMKERKNRAKKIRGVKKVIQLCVVDYCLLLYHFLLYKRITSGVFLQTKASDAAKAGKKKWVFKHYVLILRFYCYWYFLMVILFSNSFLEWDILLLVLILH